MHHRVHFGAAQPVPAPEELEFGQHGETTQLGAKALNKVDRGLAGSPGRKHVIDDEDPVTGTDCVFMSAGARLGVEIQTTSPVRLSKAK